MTEEEAKKLPVEPHQSKDIAAEYDCVPDPEYVGIARYRELVKRMERTRAANKYHVVIPCCRCGHCLVIREMRAGQIVNVGYGCRLTRATCEAYGTCLRSYLAKNGPTVFVRKLVGDESKTDFASVPAGALDPRPQPKSEKAVKADGVEKIPKAVLSGKPSVIPRHLNS